jgi:hypothetical protein
MRLDHKTMLRSPPKVTGAFGQRDQPAKAATPLYRCVVWSHIGAEDGAGALPFNLDDVQTFC